MLFARDFPRLAARRRCLPGLADIPMLGPGLFRQIALVYLRGALVCGSAGFTASAHRAQPQAAGEKPAALDIAGVSVDRDPDVGGAGDWALAGLGGAFMAQVAAGRSCRS